MRLGATLTGVGVGAAVADLDVRWRGWRRLQRARRRRRRTRRRERVTALRGLKPQKHLAWMVNLRVGEEEEDGREGGDSYLIQSGVGWMAVQRAWPRPTHPLPRRQHLLPFTCTPQLLLLPSSPFIHPPLSLPGAVRDLREERLQACNGAGNRDLPWPTCRRVAMATAIDGGFSGR